MALTEIPVMLEQFAQKHRLKTRRDTDGTLIVPGKRGHLYDYDEDNGLLGVCLMCKSARAYGFARRRLLAKGCLSRQNGDFEGCLTFDPGKNPSGASQAIKEAKCRPKRILSPQQLESLKQIGAVHKFKPKDKP